ncbi:hypothetical protein sos41_16480 [Alphaproteobacteria bacterium SO-S41]|nr:hypothetical protein sos41_16480 [Alphaproteobacteria bacterium SO-S41]
MRQVLLGAAVVAVMGLICVAARADDLPPIVSGCKAEAVVPWPAAGEGYRAMAYTEGEDCAEAHLTLALVAPTDRALWQWDFGGAASVRALYGVPNVVEMERALGAWLTQGSDKPTTSADLPAWADGAAAPEGFEPDAVLDRAGWEALRAAKRPLFCFADAPGFQTCVQLTIDENGAPIGRRAIR